MKKYIQPSVKVRVVDMTSSILAGSDTHTIPMYSDNAITSDDQEYEEAAKSNHFSVWVDEE